MVYQKQTALLRPGFQMVVVIPDQSLALRFHPQAINRFQPGPLEPDIRKRTQRASTQTQSHLPAFDRHLHALAFGQFPYRPSVRALNPVRTQFGRELHFGMFGIGKNPNRYGSGFCPEREPHQNHTQDKNQSFHFASPLVIRSNIEIIEAATRSEVPPFPITFFNSA